MSKKLDQKLSRIRNGQYTPKDFIIADAKDADMANGCKTAGLQKGSTSRYNPIQTYRDDMRKILDSDLVDIMLTSLSSAEILTQQGVYANTEITPAVRLNDTTDIWVGRGAAYDSQPALPFRTARLDRVKPVSDLGLYAITFYNDLHQDHRTLEEYARFRDEASAKGIRHFLEVFNPKTQVVTPGADFGSYNNDAVVRCLAAVSKHDRPLFLKAAYNGPAATEEIASYDPENLIFGILGGGAGTTRDCLELIRQAEKYGARVALFGRKIYYAEDSVTMVTAMRRTIEEKLDSVEATKAYHADLQKLGISPFREISADLELTEEVLKTGLG
ncbi:MAG: hypothetical protein VXW29_16820 [SAR324 cluster bacterium]|nr:hypothetical protein [SAR324 cluster bacterium]